MFVAVGDKESEFINNFLNRHIRSLQNIAQNLFGFVTAAFSAGGLARIDDDAVRENRQNQLFDVVGDAEITVSDQRDGLRGTKQRKRSARADAEFERVICSGLRDDIQKVIN